MQDISLKTWNKKISALLRLKDPSPSLRIYFKLSSLLDAIPNSASTLLMLPGPLIISYIG